jgi:hypothetical protein
MAGAFLKPVKCAERPMPHTIHYNPDTHIVEVKAKGVLKYSLGN